MAKAVSAVLGRKLVAVGWALNKRWQSGDSCFFEKFAYEQEGTVEQSLKGT